MNVTLKQSTIHDLDFLFHLRKSTMHAHLVKAGLLLSDDEHWLRVRYLIEHAYVVYDQGKRIGLFKFQEQEEQIKILQLQILPEYQGQGFGSILLLGIREKAEKSGKMLELMVLKENPAKLLYQRHGFKVVGEDQYEFRMVCPN